MNFKLGGFNRFCKKKNDEVSLKTPIKHEIIKRTSCLQFYDAKGKY